MIVLLKQRITIVRNIKKMVETFTDFVRCDCLVYIPTSDMNTYMRKDRMFGREKPDLINTEGRLQIDVDSLLSLSALLLMICT
jgi:hypothetical protein